MAKKKSQILFNKITDILLRKESSNAKYARGYNYYRSGAVRKVLLEGSYISAEVMGHERYEISIDLSQSPPLFFCNCPSIPDELCKHCVSVGLLILNNPDFIEIIPDKSNSIEKEENKKIKTNGESKCLLIIIIYLLRCKILKSKK